MPQAGDLSRNLGTIISEYMSTQKEDLRVACQLSKIASKCETLSMLWGNEYPAQSYNVDVYNLFVAKLEKLREYCMVHRGVIDRL